MNTLNGLKIQIDSILGGINDLWNQGGEAQFLMSLGIDPEATYGNLVKSSGFISPTIYAEFSSNDLSSAPMWISGAPTTAGVFVYEANGTLRSYSSALTASGDVGIANVPGGSGNGLASFNDYVYCLTGTTMYRFGPLSQTAPTLAEYWVSSLGMSALTNSDYPGIRNLTFPNHVTHPHVDGRTYLADYDGRNGRIHSFTTDSDGTNGSGSFNDLTLPPAMLPMDIKSYGTDLSILLSPDAEYAGGSISRSGNAVLALWDTTPGNRAYRFIPIKDQLATALANKNGELFVISGNLDTDAKLLRYLGGYSFETLETINEGTPPPAGAVDTYGNMIAWGGYVTYPTGRAGVFTHGYRSGKLPGNSLHHIASISDASSTLPIVSCLKFIQAGRRTPVIGWRTGDSTFGLDKLSGAGTQTSYFRSNVYHVGRKFRVRRLVIPLSTNVQSGVSIIPKIMVDNETSTFDPTTNDHAGLNVINPTNYSSNEVLIDQQDLSAYGEQNFYLELTFTSTITVGILPPITIEVEYVD